MKVEIGRTTCPKPATDLQSCAFHDAPQMAKVGSRVWYADLWVSNPFPLAGLVQRGMGSGCPSRDQRPCASTLNKMLPLQNLSCQMMVTEKAGPFNLFCKWRPEAVVHGGLCASVLLKSAHGLEDKNMWKKLCQAYRSPGFQSSALSPHTILCFCCPLMM